MEVPEGELHHLKSRSGTKRVYVYPFGYMRCMRPEGTPPDLQEIKVAAPNASPAAVWRLCSMGGIAPLWERAPREGDERYSLIPGMGDNISHPSPEAAPPFRGGIPFVCPAHLVCEYEMEGTGAG